MADPDTIAAGNPFWTFCLRIYAIPGIDTDLLSLQNDDGADVLLLLFCLWLAAEGIAPDAAQVHIDDAAAWAAGWQADVVAPLRAARSAMKTRLDEARFTDGQRAALGDVRDQVKQAELAMEAMQTVVLAALVPDAASRDTAPMVSRTAAAGHLDYYAAGQGLAFDAGSDARVQRLLDAACTAP